MELVKTNGENKKVMQDKIKVPKTTKEKPYIEFKIINGNIELRPTSSWFGGEDSGFCCSDGSEGNSCKPKELKQYINVFKECKINSINEEIMILQKKLEAVKSAFGKIDFNENITNKQNVIVSDDDFHKQQQEIAKESHRKMCEQFWKEYWLNEDK